MGKRPYVWSCVLGCLALVGMLVAPYMALLYAPVAHAPGDPNTLWLSQKIFYIHVPSAIAAYAGFFLVFVFSVLYLWRRDKRWDIWASCSAEVGVLFCTLVLLTGPVWARAMWGAWWTWEPRLVLTLVLWLIYVAYMMLKSYSENSLQSARFRAVLGIIGFLDVPLVHFAIALWGNVVHPPRAEFASEASQAFTEALVFCIIAFLVLFSAILVKRVALERARDEFEYLKAEIRDRKAILGQMLHE